MLFSSRILIHFDYVLMILIAPIIGFSLFLLNETSQALFLRQLSYAFLGTFVFIFVFLIQFRNMYKGIIIFYIVCILLLVAVEFIGTSKLGAQRWIDLKIFSLQPSEIMKIAIILFLSHYVSRNPPPADGYGVVEFLKINILILIPFFLILIEPDLGSALIILFMGYGMLFVIGVNKKIWIFCAVIFLLFIPIAYKFILKPYQIERIAKLVNGEPSEQVKQSLIAIGSGGLTGKSKENATQANLKFLPIVTSDFIFAHFAERFGFLGSIFLIGIYIAIVIHLFSFVFLDEKDYYLKVMASCIAMLFFIYTSVNIAMTIELAPVVGIPLPMFSYGGSSFLTFVILIAMFQNAIVFRFFNYGNNKGPLNKLDKFRRQIP